MNGLPYLTEKRKQARKYWVVLKINALKKKAKKFNISVGNTFALFEYIYIYIIK